MTGFSQLIFNLKGSSGPVAFSDKEIFTGEDLYRKISQIANSLPDCENFLLSCEDSYLFTAAFLTLVIKGKNIYLPPNYSSGTLGELSEGKFLLNEEWIAEQDDYIIDLNSDESDNCKITIYSS